MPRKQNQERQYCAEIRDDGISVSDGSGREIAFIPKREVFEQYPYCPEEAWESLLHRIDALYCIIA